MRKLGHWGFAWLWFNWGIVRALGFVWLLIGAGSVSYTSLGRAQEPSKLAGRWQAGPLSEVWTMQAWGAACGPQPQGSSQAGGLVQVEEQGAELSITGIGRSFSTRQCWEQFPGLAPATHSAGDRSWKTVCRTSPTDPRQAKVTTSIQATDSTLTLNETGEYRFSINSQICTANVRRTRSYRLLEPKFKPEAAPIPDPVTEPSAPVPVEKRCTEVGAPARLEVRPERKLIRAGEHFRFSARVLDKNGCAVNVPIRWELGKAEGVHQGPPGTVHVDANAREQEVPLLVRAEQKSIQVFIEVASAERYEALLQQGTFNAQGESQKTAEATIPQGAIGAESSTSQEANDKKTRFAVIVGALALGLLALAAALLFLRKKGAPAPAPAPGPPRPQSLRPQITRKICPLCGTQYPAEAVFCGTDGASLVPLN
ncbi:MAG: hypothetical protein SFV15_23645 [Polyangiaceae bacterium]|nr:hypothetical protein [Polyangiaceae bacterium]